MLSPSSLLLGTIHNQEVQLKVWSRLVNTTWQREGSKGAGSEPGVHCYCHQTCGWARGLGVVLIYKSKAHHWIIGGWNRQYWSAQLGGTIKRSPSDSFSIDERFSRPLKIFGFQKVVLAPTDWRSLRVEVTLILFGLKAPAPAWKHWMSTRMALKGVTALYVTWVIWNSNVVDWCICIAWYPKETVMHFT